MLTTAKINDVDPYAWLTLTLERLAAGWPNRGLDQLMPWNYQTRTAAAPRLPRFNL
jgi:transposase